MADKENKDLLPPGPGSGAQSKSEAAAWGCALVAGIGFAAMLGSMWLFLPAGECVPGFPCTV